MSQLPLFHDSSSPAVAPDKTTRPSRVTTVITPPPPTLAADAQWRQYKSADLHIAYVLLRSRRKSIGLHVNENGLRITAPNWVSVSQIEQAIHQKSHWVLRKLNEWEQRKAELALGQAQWREHGRIPYLGTHISLALQPSLRETTLTGDPANPVAGNTLALPLDSDASSDRIQDQTHAWLQQQATWYFGQRLEHFVAQSPKSLKRWRLAGPAKRWGSCSSDGTIMLNWRLIHFSKTIIDYVIAHEVAHLKEMNHSAAFWREVERLMPDYASAQQQLKNHHPGSLPLL